jgi:hypothetical protein
MRQSRTLSCATPRHAASALLLTSQVVVPHPAHSGNCDKSGAVQLQVITTLTKINMIISGAVQQGRRS